MTGHSVDEIAKTHHTDSYTPTRSLKQVISRSLRTNGEPPKWVLTATQLVKAAVQKKLDIVDTNVP